MRLTLRTLLAYMDGVLSPAEQAELKAQIEASDFASELIHRTGDVMRRPQVGVPELLGLGPVDDPNTIAEYLDGTLPDENVADFERACLESEMLLAEAASVHHVLKLILDEVTEVDPDTLKRMHWLPQALEEAKRREADAAIAAEASRSPASSAVTSKQSEVEVPDYLRRKKPLWLRWTPVLGVVLLLAIVGSVVSTMFTPEEPTVAKVEEASPPAAVDSPVVVDEEPAEPTSEVESVPEPVSEVTSGESDIVEPQEEAQQEPLQETEKVAPAGESPAEVPEGEASPEAEESAAEGDSATETESPDGNDSELTPAGEEAETPEEELKPVELVMGGSETALLVVEEEPGTWKRVALKKPLPVGSSLVALPTYRPAILLGENLQVELVDYTEIVLQRELEHELPKVELVHGRLLLTNKSETDSVSLTLVIEGVSSEVTLSPGLPLAVEADRSFKVGLDLLNQSPDAAVSVYAQQANVTWEANGESYEAQEAKLWGVTATGGAEDPREYKGEMGWVKGINNNAWDRRASPQLPKRVAFDEEVWPQLMEIVGGDDYKEVRALAANCSLAVGHPDPLVSSFDDESQLSSWQQNLEKLRVAASRSQLQAERIRQAMEEQYGEKLSTDLFVLLCGFRAEEVGESGEELQRGALLQVIEWLESDSLACRVFATINFEQITGKNSLFTPTGTPGRRRLDLRKIRKKLRDNDLRAMFEEE